MCGLVGPRSRSALSLAWILLASALFSGCYLLRTSSGGGKTLAAGRSVNAADIAVPEGYRIEDVASGLNFPVGVAFDGDRVFVLEAGYSYGEVFSEPRILEVLPDGSTKVVARGTNPPWNGFSFANGSFFVAEGGEKDGGRILKVGLDGTQTVLVDKLPSLGDHHTNGAVVGPDGKVYFGQGTATNSGVVGEDDAAFGWLARHPDFHDTPCKDITLTGENFTSKDAVSGKGEVETGAFLAFGTKSTPNQVIPGKVPCNGAVMRVEQNGGGLELVAWGFRNPFGLAFAPDGRLYVTDNGYDERGSRPVFGAADWLWAVDAAKPGAWFGWPDYADGTVITDARYTPPLKKRLTRVLAADPAAPPKPVAWLAVHSSSNGLDFSRSDTFGHAGQAFIAQFGDMAPKTGKVETAVGFKVVRVDVTNGVSEDFVVNRGHSNGPGSKLGTGGLERPVAVRFHPKGEALYVADFGVMRVTENGPEPLQNTGVLWRVVRGGGR